MIEHTPHLLNEFILVENEKAELRDYYIYFLWFEEELLYIGYTVNLTNRIRSHKKDKMFDKVTYQTYFQTTKEKMLIIERANINHYKPLFNDSTRSILKKPDYCYVRNGTTSHKYEKGVLYGDDYNKIYYNGKYLVQYTNTYTVMIKYIDNVKVGILKLFEYNFKFQLLNNELKVKKIPRDLKEDPTFCSRMKFYELFGEN